MAADSSSSSTSSVGPAPTQTATGSPEPSESASTTPDSGSETAPPSFQNGAGHLAFGSLLGWIVVVVGFGLGGLLV